MFFLSQKQKNHKHKNKTTKPNKTKESKKSELPSETQSIQCHRLFVITVIILGAPLLMRITLPYPTERKFAVGTVSSA